MLRLLRGDEESGDRVGRGSQPVKAVGESKKAGRARAVRWKVP